MVLMPYMKMPSPPMRLNRIPVQLIALMGLSLRLSGVRRPFPRESRLGTDLPRKALVSSEGSGSGCFTLCTARGSKGNAKGKDGRGAT